jgi:hypothetical protein
MFDIGKGIRGILHKYAVWQKILKWHLISGTSVKKTFVKWIERLIQFFLPCSLEQSFYGLSYEIFLF